MRSPRKRAYVECAATRGSEKNLKNWRVPDNGHGEILEYPPRKLLGNLAPIWFNSSQQPRPRKWANAQPTRTANFTARVLLQKITKPSKQTSSRDRANAPKLAYQKPPKIGQCEAPAVKIGLVRFKTSFLIKKRHGDTGFFYFILERVLHESAAKNVSCEF